MKNIFAVDADDASLQSKSGGVFGLNKGVIKSIAFEDKPEEDGKAAYKAVLISVQVGDREYYQKLFLNESVYSSGENSTLLNPGDEGYENAFFDTYSQYVAVVKHALGAVGVSKEVMNAALANFTNATLFQGMEVLTKLAPANYQAIPIDVFLEYQWNIPEGKDRTFLTLPKNMKGGAFLCASMPGDWKEVRTGEGLHYINSAGQKHLFERSSTYMESNKANQQGVGAEIATVSPTSAAATSSWVN